MNFSKPYPYFLIMLSLLQFFLAGCIDTTNFQLNNVSGFVFDYYGLPVRNCWVHIGSFPGDYSYNNGTFLIENISMPYNLTITKYDNEMFISKYLNLTSNNPNVYSLKIASYGTVSIDISFPPFEAGKVLLLKFISKDITPNYYTFVNGGEDDTTARIRIRTTQYFTGNNAKLVYLLVSFDGEKITAFDAFGIKDFFLKPANNAPVVFKNKDVTFNPDDVQLGVNVQPPAGSYLFRTKIYIDFDDYDNDDDIFLCSSEENNFTVPVPILQGIGYSIKAMNEYWYSNYKIKGINYVQASPGENIVITHNKPVNIIYPPDGGANVNDTASLQIEDNGVKGIYIYNMRTVYGPGVYFYMNIVTDKSSVHLKEFKTEGFPVLTDQTYIWSVTKYTGYNSIDEFVSTIFVVDDRNDKSQTLGPFSFTTAP